MEWKQIPGWERYEVSNTGVVRSRDISCKAAHNSTAIRKGRTLTQVSKGGRYLAVTLTAPNKRKQFLVHDLVALAFIGSKPAGLHTCHNDDDKRNNAASNLRYDTVQGNNEDRYKNDGIAQGERHGMARLTADQVKAIRARSDESGKRLAKEFGITYPHLHAIVKRRVWKHI